ncbi:Sodium/hydrogen exchanger 1 [Lamellibrachia satsuma]|nr:Sodium/hydrogen exchanger 1 [Lamellibrachia satsuma]
MIGPGLYALSLMGVMGTFNITLVHCFVFSSLIVAVDPVAVLAIFQEIGVNNVLYFLIFGESLLNDAVTVVLYNMMKSFNVMEVIPPNQLLLGFVSFFTVSLGGLTTGVAFGLMSAILTRGTRHVQVVEPLTIFVFAYTAYLVAELFHFSGIISIIGCGLVQAQYAFHNISNKSCTTVKYFSKMMSSTCDSVIFLFLGLSLVQSERIWHSGFIFTAIGLCLLVRFIVVFFLTFIANKLMRLRPVNIEEQFIMAYGGLRGAVAFSLVANLDKKTIPHQGLFETATLAVIIFTVFMQGITIKPLVRLLSIQRDSEKVVSIFEEINDHVIDHVMAGMEVVLGHYGTNSFREIAERVDTHYMQPYLLREPQTKDDHIMELYQKIALQLHLELVAGPKAAELYSLSYMDLYKIPVWTPHPEMASIMRGKELFEESVAMKLRRCSAPANPSYLTQTKEGRRSVNPDVRVYEPSQSDEQGFRLVQQCIRQLHTSEPKLEPKVPVVRDVRRLLDKNLVMKTNPRYDQTLSHDFANFLLHHLQEKQMRNVRFQHAISMYSSPPSSNPVTTSITPSDTVLLNIYNPEVDRTNELPLDETVSTNVRKSQSEKSTLDQSHTSGLPPRIQLNPNTFRPGETLARKTKPNLAKNGKKHQNRDEPGPSKK